MNKINSIESEYNTLIIGGGITGAGIYRDLSLHNIPTLLVDKYDFGSKTSQYSSKMFHGGIRYLETYNFGLVLEALSEKNFWLKNAPHLCYEVPFLLPIYKDSKYPLFMTRIGLFLYDLLSLFSNSPHKILNRKKSLEKFPLLKANNLCGCGIYHDAIVDDSKLTLENIFDGNNSPICAALSYCEVSTILKDCDRYVVTLHDRLTQETRKIMCKNIVIATGPYTDHFMKEMNFTPWSPQLLPSKGSHLWLKNDKLPLSHPAVLQTNDKRIIFVIPQKEMVLIGTTEIKLDQAPEEVSPDKNEVQYLLDNVNQYFDVNVDESDIISSFSGIRPLVKKAGASAGKTSRKHKIITPQKGCFVIIGGKLTTFRTMGQKITKTIVKDAGGIYSHTLTKTSLRSPSLLPPFSKEKLNYELITKIVKEEAVRTFEDLLIRRLLIYTRNHFKAEMIADELPKDFDQFFIGLIPHVKEWLTISEDDIRNFGNRKNY